MPAETSDAVECAEEAEAFTEVAGEAAEEEQDLRETSTREPQTWRKVNKTGKAREAAEEPEDTGTDLSGGEDTNQRADPTPDAKTWG